MNCLGLMRAVALLMGLLLVCQLQVDGAALEKAKEAAKALAESASKKAEQTPDAPQTGGIRSAIAHTGVSMAAEKAMDAISLRYPVVKPFAPLAKPLVNSAHKAINKMFTRKPQENVDESQAKEQGELPKKKGSFLNRIKSAVGVGAGKDKTEKEIEKGAVEPEKIDGPKDKKPEAKAETEKKEEKTEKEPKEVKEEPKKVEQEPKEAKEEPKEEPKEVKEEPKEIKEEPKEIKEGPKEAKEVEEKPKEETKEVKEEPKEVEQEPSNDAATKKEAEPKKVEEEPEVPEESDKEEKKTPKNEKSGGKKSSGRKG